MTEAPATILIVDDEITVRKRLEALLLPRGYKVITASNGLEALQRVGQERPDLIVLDVLIPEIDGFEVCRRLKSNTETSHIPVVLVTVLGEMKDRIQGYDAGADDFLTKPVHREEFLARIRASLRLKQSIARQVDTLQRQLQAATAQRVQLFAMLAHELRTQLDTILGFSEMLQEQTCGPLNVQQAEYVQYIVTSSIQVLDVLHSLLILIQFEAGEAEQQHEILVLKPLLEESLLLVRGRALAHNITLSLEVADAVEAVLSDGPKLRQVIFNLLSQALECTNEHGEVGIQAVKLPDRIAVTVWNTGAGFTPEDLRGFFEELPHLAERYTGKNVRMSLGLALTRQFVERLGGTMSVASRLGQGSILTLYLPIPGRPSQLSLLIE